AATRAPSTVVFPAPKSPPTTVSGMGRFLDGLAVSEWAALFAAPFAHAPSRWRRVPERSNDMLQPPILAARAHSAARARRPSRQEPAPGSPHRHWPFIQS